MARTRLRLRRRAAARAGNRDARANDARRPAHHDGTRQQRLADAKPERDQGRSRNSKLMIERARKRLRKEPREDFATTPWRPVALCGPGSLFVFIVEAEIAGD